MTIDDFLDNKYRKIYFDLIQKRIDNPLHKEREYCERHHIIPRSLGGSDEKSNLVNLTAREHFIAHRLLVKITEGTAKRSMWWSLHRTLYSRPSEVPLNSRDYEKFRIQWSAYLKENHHSKRIPEWNKKMSEIVTKDWEDNENKRIAVSKAFSKSHEDRKKENPEAYYENQRKNSKKGNEAVKDKWKNNKEWVENERKRMSDRVKGEKNPMFGKKLSEDSKKIISEKSKRKRWVHNDKESVLIDKDLLEEYLSKGYERGRGWIYVHMNDGRKNIKVNKKEKEVYLKKGYKMGSIIEKEVSQ